MDGRPPITGIRSCHGWNAHQVPGTVPSPLHALCHLMLTKLYPVKTIATMQLIEEEMNVEGR